MTIDVRHFEECMMFLHFCSLEDRLDTSSTASTLMREYVLGHNLSCQPEEFIEEMRAWRREQRGISPTDVAELRRGEALRRLVGLATETIGLLEEFTDDLSSDAQLKAAEGLLTWATQKIS
jgi:hypothetical protein